MVELYRFHAIPEVVPEFQSDIFASHEHARFAVGQIAEGNSSRYPVENLAYHRLRANVYVREEGMISDDGVALDGGEYDDDDARSIHMAVLENYGDTQRMVGSMRLISRGNDSQLPIEDFFSDMFVDNPAPAASCEVSRYIVRHEERQASAEISWALYQQSMATAINYRLGPMYATIDPSLARLMRFKQVPITELAPPTRVEKYNSTSLPVVIDLDVLAQRLEARTPGALSEMTAKQGKFTYFGERELSAKQFTLGKTALGAVGE